MLRMFPLQNALDFDLGRFQRAFAVGLIVSFLWSLL